MADYIESIIEDDSPVSSSILGDSAINSEIPQQILISKQEVFVGYYYNGVFYKDEEHTQLLSNVKEAIYINVASENEDFYRYNGTSYLRTGKDSLTKEQADTYYASKVHTHLFSDISNVSFLSKQEIENILNQEE